MGDDIRKIRVEEFTPIGFSEFQNVTKLVMGGSNLEKEIHDHFLASFRNSKATQQEFQVQFLKTELSFCKEALNK